MHKSASRADAVLLCFYFLLLACGGSANRLEAAGHKPPAKLEQRPLFQSGDLDYHCYRIPSLVVTNRGTILALAEARRSSRSDHGDIDLALRRSFDGGKTWTELRIIADDGGHTMGNPCPVVDRTNGTIWLPFCRDNKRVLLTKSNDDGKTWSKPVDITDVAMNPAWHWVGTGPGHGIQLRDGRLLIPCWADATPRLGEIQLSYCFYSDDHGAAWQLGSALDANASDECEVVELTDDTLYMNMRSRQGKKQRAYAFSQDGGKTWSTVKYDPRLPEPSCQGSVVRFTDTRQFAKNRVLLSTPANPKTRTQMTVRVSYDECRSWPVSKVLYPGSAAYSDLAVTDQHDVLCLYEADSYSKIVLARFNIEWLTDSEDTLRRRQR